MADTPVYGNLPSVPTMTLDGHEHVKYDFCHGIRVMVDKEASQPYHVRFWDEPSGVLCYDKDVEPGTVITSNKKYYVKWRLEISCNGEKLLDHTLDLDGRDVLVQCPGIKSSAIGDTVAMMKAIDNFSRCHGCRLHVAMCPAMASLFAPAYPAVRFISHDMVDKLHWYAIYHLGLFWKDDECNNAPVDHRLSGNFRNYAYILGVQDMPMDTAPAVCFKESAVPEEPYVCIGVQASSACKTWMGDGFRGWANVAKWLKDRGRRVLCIDKEPCQASSTFHMEMPNGVEDFTGYRPLDERLSLLAHADCFIGGSSGLSWLAWCAGCPVVLISGFTEDWNEFYTPYRVRLRMSCSGCWNDVRHEFDHKSMLWCPRHMDDDARRFECSRLITSKLVIDAVQRTPAFCGTV